jgi:SAM-dependent methyltransferase
MPPVKEKEWYTTWFDSPYYDLLYKERNQHEADTFIKNLIDFLKPKPNALMLDIACGKGRHALSLNKMGYRVDGFDLSAKNIKAAKKAESGTLSFSIHDMRRPFMVNYYDVIFNLFTSFGYFENERENHAVLDNIHNALKPGGIFVLDFMNMEKALHCVPADDKKEVEGIKFHVFKSINKQGFLIKQIHVEDGPLRYDFEERIKIFTAAELRKYITDCGFEIMRSFGDYNLGEFNPASSNRLILISKKK